MSPTVNSSNQVALAPIEIPTTFRGHKINTLENIEDDFAREAIRALFQNMGETGKNIPWSKEQIALLPLGFTETALFPTKSFEQKRSKYFLPKQYPHLQSLLNLFGL